MSATRKPLRTLITLSLLTALVLSALSPLLLPWSGSITRALASEASAAATSLKFDFGSTSSPVAAGYQQVANTTLYSAERGYGVDRVTSYRDRGSPDDLRRDFTNGVYQFLVDVPNGDYYVRIIAGDWIASNRTTVDIEGVHHGTISSGAANFAELTATVTVGDGQLSFAFGRDGRVNAIEIVPMKAPSGLHVIEQTLSADPSLSIGWQPVDGAANYQVYRAAAGEENFSVVGTTPDTSFTDTSIELGLTYVYAVTQVNGDGIESARSEELVVAVFDESQPAPAAPADLRIESALADAVILQWEAVDSALLYYVYRADAAEGPFAKMASTTEPRFTDDTSTRTTNSYYYVVAVNHGGLSQPSNVQKTPITNVPLRQMERLDRGLVAVPVEQGVLISWRMLGSDPHNIAFNLYRDGQKVNAAPITASTNYLDPDGSRAATYSVRAIVNGKEGAPSASVGVWANSYLDVPLQRPAGGVTPDGVAYTYHANDVSVGDLTGDGRYELVLKWDPSNSKDNSRSGYTGEVFLDAYTLEGELLWRIGMGRNIRAGAHYTQFLVYDFDGDDRAELVARTADGTTDGQGNVIGDPTADYRSSNGYVLSGPEYLTVFDGLTGRALATTNYEPPRGNVCDWGDCYGNRVDRFLAGVAYLDGERPSIVMARGYYTRSVLAAFNWRNGKLTRQWTFDSNDPGYAGYAGQGNHNLSIGDVDGDGRDEITYGAMAVDDDGTGLYTTGLGHGDAMHMSDLDPDRPGLEVFQVHESRSAAYGLEMRDARTGEILWGQFTGQDTGRGVAADIDPRYKGAEAWAVGGAWNSRVGGLYSAKGQKLSDSIPSSNFAIWWDGDLLRELLDHKWSDTDQVGVGTIDKWDYQNNRLVNLLTADGTFSNNHTKGNPGLQADILGDWREEVLWRTEDSSALRLYATPYPTEHRFVTLMHDPIYRLGIAWQNVGYNQPPHTSFYLGADMQAPPRPRIRSGEAIPATVNVDPQTWNVKSDAGPRLATVYIELPEGYDLSNVAADTIRLFADGSAIDVQATPRVATEHGTSGKPVLVVKLDGQTFAQALAAYNGTIEVSASGYLIDGSAFTGSDLVTILH